MTVGNWDHISHIATGHWHVVHTSLTAQTVDYAEKKDRSKQNEFNRDKKTGKRDTETNNLINDLLLLVLNHILCVRSGCHNT